MRLQPDIIKLDRSLVGNVDTDPAKAALIDSFVRFARRTGATIVAEGIETPETAALLRDLGCANGQGHHYAQSMAAELLPVWVSTRPQPSGALDVGTPRSRMLRAVR